MSDQGLLLLGLGLLAAAILLVVAEVFIPSGGLLAILAGIATLVGVVVLFGVSHTWGLMGVLAVLVLGPMAFGFALKVWPNTPIGRRMLLGDVSEEELAKQRLAEKAERDRQQALVGAEGKALSTLRPVGVILLGSERHEALAETGMIESGARVRVTAVRDNEIKVRAI